MQIPCEHCGHPQEICPSCKKPMSANDEQVRYGLTMSNVYRFVCAACFKRANEFLRLEPWPAALENKYRQ